MAKIDYSELDGRALALIRSRKGGVLQNALWKELEISSRDCTRLVLRLLEAGAVTRAEDKNGSSKTYRISAVAAEKVAEKAAVMVKKGEPGEKEEKSEPVVFNPLLLMAGESIVPCVACSEECNVAECPMLEEWVYELAFSELK
ncbi:MAG TPA: hypothetical protein O0X39_07985 [Methanocorpusculum sp.]|nr:hypothetical protein [Methanocorpusculum sp.]